MEEMDRKIERILDDLIKFRRELHRFPELGFREYRTAEKTAGYMRALGLEVAEGVGGTGVVGLLRGKGEGPTVALRACLDALAIEERSGVPFASENEGVMHACGHDGNMTMVLGAANILSQYADRLNGNVKFVFQASEEDTGGAAAVIREGVLENPRVDAIVTPHNWPGIAQGLFVVKPGVLMASSDIFRLEIKGKPGHGAWPHLAVDPVVVAADVVSALQNIVSREIDPMQTAAISIGKIHGGTAVNIIPESVVLDGTVRAFDPGVRNFIQARIGEVAEGIAHSARARCDLTYDRVMPPLINDGNLTAQAGAILREALGPDAVSDDFAPVMGCEEFSLFQERIPGLFLYVGNDAEGDDFPLHSPEYRFNDAIIAPAVKALAAIALNYRKN